MKFLRAFVILVLLQAAAWLSQAQAMINYNTPENVTASLYDTAYQHFGPTPENTWFVENFLSPKLYHRLWNKVNQPPEGPQKDVFFCSEVPPSVYAVGKVVTNGDKSKVDVTLTWMGKKGIKTHVWVMLKRINGAWLVDDIDYGVFGKLSNYL